LGNSFPLVWPLVRAKVEAMVASTSSPSEPAVYLRSLTLHGFRAFADGTRIDFTREDGRPAQWTILLGENGTGKTAVLQAIAAMQPVLERDDCLPKCGVAARDWLAWWDFNRSADKPDIELELVACKKGLGGPTTSDRISMTAGARFVPVRVTTIVGDDRTNAGLLQVVGYGLGNTDYNGVVQTAFQELLHSRSELPRPESWLLELHHSSVLEDDSGQKEFAKRTYESVTRCIQAVLPDIEGVRIRRTERRLYADAAIRAEFLTPYGWVLFEQLGVGYQSIASWTIDLLRRLHDLYGHLDRPETGPAVVLVDEFDLHLHPKWQLTLMEHLGKIFTNTQFVITAHSPLVVQGAGRDANLVVLQRQKGEDGKTVIVADNDPVRVQGWRLDQIVTSDLYGLASARPPEYAALFEERSALATKIGRSPEEDLQLRELTRRIEAEAPPSIDADLAALAAKLQAAQKA
jgi:predicted ATP-binding protein involved in virulence